MTSIVGRSITPSCWRSPGPHPFHARRDRLPPRGSADLRAGESHRSFRADRLVCTLPFQVLRTVEIAPPLPPEKRRAVEELQSTSVSRVFLQTRTRFWEAQGLSGFVLTDQPWSVFPRTADPASCRGILESYKAGALACGMATSQESPERKTVREVAAIFPELPDLFEGGGFKFWDADEWARGAYTWFRPGQMRTLLPLLGRAEGRLHFAGEHTSDHPGWMQGGPGVGGAGGPGGDGLPGEVVGA